MERQSRAATIIERIRSDIDAGLGIVPVLGSGISAQSGIPAGFDYQAYLFYCVSRLFADLGSGGAGPDGMWDPSRLRWPPYTSARTYESLDDDMVKWTAQQSEALCKMREDSARTQTADPEMRARWQSLGAVADWRAMLHLLSRTRIRNNKVHIAEPDPRVIDSFFINLTEGKRPNTAHMLLAHLADVLRMRVILTTNFDTLLEEAFRQLEMPVATFDVHYDAGFPDGRFARAQRSIVKINGGRYGLRADFTLDRLPDAADFENFTSYLVPLGSTGKRTGAPVWQRNLLVMGVSGQERRTIALICQAMLTLPNLSTYWVCHREREIEGVRASFTAIAQALSVRSSGRQVGEPAELLKNLTIAATPDVGLFLLHLYQRMFLCLPPSGVPFKAVWSLPPPPYELARLDSEKSYADGPARRRLEDGVARIDEALRAVLVESKQAVSSTTKPWRRVILVTGQSGVPSVAAQVFLAGDDPRQRIWVDIEEDWHAVDLAAAVLEAVRLRVGIAEPLLLGLTAASLCDLDRVGAMFKAQFARLVRYSRRHFLIFINGRDSPRTRAEEAAHVAVERVLSWLATEETVTTVVLGWDDARWKDAVVPCCFRHIVLVPLLGVPPENTTVKKVLRELKELSDERERFRFARFLAVLSLFRRPCYLSVTNAWPFVGLSSEMGDLTPLMKYDSGEAAESHFPDKDQRRFEYVARDRAKPAQASYLDILRKVGAIRDDDGQAVLMHRRVREELRKKLADDNYLPNAGWEIQANQGIADWYLKLYRASGDVAAAIESFHHRLDCIRAAWEHAQRGHDRHDQEYLWESAATEARVTLRLMRPALSPPVLQSYLAQRRLDGLCRELDRLSELIETPNVRAAATEAREQLKQLHAQWEGTREPAAAERAGASESILRVDSLDEVRRLIYAREYQEAEKQLREHFKSMGFPESSLREDRPGQGIVRYDACRDKARTWAVSIRRDQAILGKAVRILRRYHGLCLLRAELYQRLSNEHIRLLALTRAEAMYVCATELMRNIDDLRFIQNENAYLRANQGLVLSWMNRPREAHRRFNEAYGYLNQMLTAPMSLRFATIDARRAEAFLSCVRRRRAPAQQAEARGFLYDAIGAVERASYRSVDQPYPRWHSYLAALTMEVCCEIARQEPDAQELYARARDRSGYGEWFYSCFEAGFHAVGTDPVRLRHYVTLADEFEEKTRAFRADYRSGIYLSRDCLDRIAALKEKCLVLLDGVTMPSDAEVCDYIRPAMKTPALVVGRRADASPGTAQAGLGMP